MDHLIHRKFSLPEKIFRKAWLLWLHGEGLRRKDSPSDKTVGLSSFSTTEKKWSHPEKIEDLVAKIQNIILIIRKIE